MCVTGVWGSNSNQVQCISTCLTADLIPIVTVSHHLALTITYFETFLFVCFILYCSFN